MTKTYMLNGLDCANCAAKIEGSVRLLDGVSEAQVNFATATLSLEADDALGSRIMRLVEETVHKYEPDVVVTDKSAEIRRVRDDDDDGGRAETIKLIVGALIFAAGMILRAFDVNQYVTLAVLIVSYAVLGGPVVLSALRNIARGEIFDENFLMSIATIGAFIIGEYPEAVAVMLFYQVGERFQSMAVRKSRKSISALMDIRPDYANLKRNGELVRVEPDTVNIGDIIVVKPGEKIPLDGVVTDGEAYLDTTALTGESVPRAVKVSDTVLSGCVNQNGVLTIEVTKSYGESTAAKILDLVENAASKKAPAENFITRFARYYTPAVVGLAALVAVIPPLFLGGEWAEWVNRGLIFLVISCPCALVVSIPLGFFGGIGGASKRGVLVKGGNYLDALASLDTVVFDKTGTLTKGVFEVVSVRPANGFSKSEVLELAAKAEAFSNHPVALSITKAYSGGIDREGLDGYTELAGHGVSVRAGGVAILAGNGKLMDMKGIEFSEAPDSGTKVCVAADGVFAGCIVIADEVKPDSRAAVAALKERGVRETVMLTGDSREIAEAVAAEIGIDKVMGELLPGDKVEIVGRLSEQTGAKGKLAFVGDGINDAPVLARADIGIAMGGLGSDAAIEAADIVLMTDEPSKLADAVDIARFTKRVVSQNIVFALVIKAAFMVLGACGIATMWEAVFADVGVALLAVLNASRIQARA